MKKIVTVLLLIVFVANVYSQQVSGVVKSGKTNIENVVVTDGKNFAKTDKKGHFILDVDSVADFIYIITPSGYVASFDGGAPVFYKKFNPEIKKYDFDLIKWGNTETYTLVAIADPQPKSEHFDEYKTLIFPDIKNTIDEYRKNANTTLAGIMLGDIVWDALELFEPMKKLNSTAQIPIYPVIGNHDHNQNIKGDHASAANYREAFGPTYYAFNMGNDYFIVLDNIIYSTRKDYQTSITQNQLEWLEKYLAYVPKGSHLIVAMHAPFVRWKDTKNKTMKNGEKLLEICRDYKVNILSGHMHRNHNIEIKPDFFEHNIAAPNGALWIGNHNNDGSPRGYKIFESAGKKFSWYYKSINKPMNYQMEIFNRGMSKYHPNSVIAAVWDWNEKWQVECYQDGKKINIDRVYDASPNFFRELKAKNNNRSKNMIDDDLRTFWYFAANPDKDARQITVIAKDNFGNVFTDSLKLDYAPDVQAHRGGTGIMPENTVEAMINAINLGVNTVEIDLNISKDRKVIVSHDPWMNYTFVTRPDGKEIAKNETKNYNLYSMTYDSIAKYETGLKPHPDFPNQKKIKTHIPLVADLIDSVENYTERNKLSPIFYNIEIKSATGKDNVFSPAYEEFCDLVMEVLLSKNIGNRLIVQSFDTRALNYLNKKYPDLKLSYNVEAGNDNFEENIAKLNFIPAYYSPNFNLVNESLIRKCKQSGMKIVVWTVDKPEDIEKMINFKVDAIISNYPDIVLEKIRKY